MNLWKDKASHRKGEGFSGRSPPNLPDSCFVFDLSFHHLGRPLGVHQLWAISIMMAGNAAVSPEAGEEQEALYPSKVIDLNDDDTYYHESGTPSKRTKHTWSEISPSKTNCSESTMDSNWRCWVIGFIIVGVGIFLLYSFSSQNTDATIESPMTLPETDVTDWASKQAAWATDKQAMQQQIADLAQELSQLKHDADRDTDRDNLR